MTLTQLSAAAGALIALGLVLIVTHLLPARPQLKTAMAHLAPDRGRRDEPVTDHLSNQDRIGLWAQRTLPSAPWAPVPVRELAILRVSQHHWWGEKVVLGVLGLVILPMVSLILGVAGITLPVLVPVGGSALLGAGLFFLPDLVVRQEAKEARGQFDRALGAYIEIVGLERLSGSGTTQALENAAEVGDSWVFVRLREELARARLSGTAPWDNLAQLAEDLHVPALNDLAGILRSSGESGASIYGQLRARSQGLRNALLSEEHGKANAASQKMTVPVTVLVVIFMCVALTPALLGIVTST